MRSMKRLICCVALGFSLVGARQAGASVVASQYVEFTTTATPIQSLTDTILSFGTPSSGFSGIVHVGNFPAGLTSTFNNVVPLTGGVINLLPTWTSFSLYSITTVGLPTQYGIAVAINQALDQGGTFDSLFDKNVDAAYNNGSSYTEADLINQFRNNGSADAAFTQGISNTPIAEIPYGTSAPIYFFSAGTLGGTMEVTATNAPEPASVGVVLIGSIVAGRRRR